MDVLPPVAGAPTEVAAWAAADAAADVATNAATNAATNGATNGATNAAPEPERLHSTLWRASQLGRPRQAVFASGFAALDAVLPGGGWPAGVLTELLLPHPGVGEMRLMAPVLARLQQSLHERCVMWFDPPAQPCAWALGALGLVARQMVLVRSAAALPGAPGGKGRRAGDPSSQHSSLWALEHALKSGHVGAVLAWLPARLPADALRRLQLAAQAHEGPAFVLRGDEAVRQASPAPLRLVLSAAAPDWLRVQVLKRRGPPLAQPLLLELPPVLAAPAAGRARAGSVVPGARAGAMGAAEVMAAPLMAADAAAAQAALPPWPSLNTPGAL